MFTSLEPCNNAELQTAVLNEMADYFLKEKIVHKPGQYMKSEESGRNEKKFTTTGKIMRERRQRERDGKVIGK
jgi:hypothetical protein